MRSETRRTQRSTLALPSRARMRRTDFPGALRLTDLLEPPGRLGDSGVIFVLAKLLVGRFRFGADDGAQAIDADVGFAGSERWRRRHELKRGMGSSTTDRKFRSTDRGTASMSSSLSRFSGWRSQSLSLGEGLTDLTGARDGTRADGVLDRGRRRLFSF